MVVPNLLLHPNDLQVPSASPCHSWRCSSYFTASQRGHGSPWKWSDGQSPRTGYWIRLQNSWPWLLWSPIPVPSESLRRRHSEVAIPVIFHHARAEGVLISRMGCLMNHWTWISIRKSFGDHDVVPEWPSVNAGNLKSFVSHSDPPMAAKRPQVCTLLETPRSDRRFSARPGCCRPCYCLVEKMPSRCSKHILKLTIQKKWSAQLGLTCTYIHYIPLHYISFHYITLYSWQYITCITYHTYHTYLTYTIPLPYLPYIPYIP